MDTAAKNGANAATTPTETITLICPNLACRRPISAPVSMRGSVMRCAHCMAPFLVPREARNAADKQGKKYG